MKNRLNEFDIIPVQIISERILDEKTGEKVMTIKVKWQHGGIVNNNNRRYRKEILKREIDKLKPGLPEGKVFGCGYHPTAEPQIPDVAMLWKDVEMLKDGSCIGTAEVIPTKIGKDVQAVIRAGGKIGFSSRGYGTVTRKVEGGKSFNDVNDDFILRSPGDVVLNPSVHGAGILKVVEQMSEQVEEVEDEFEEILKEFNEPKDEELLSEVVKLRAEQAGLEKRLEALDTQQVIKPENDDGDEGKVKLSEEQKNHVTLTYQYKEAVESGFIGSFERYVKMLKEGKENYHALHAPTAKQLERRRLEEAKKLEEKANRPNFQKYNEACFSGFEGSFEDFQEHQKKVEKERPLREAIKQESLRVAKSLGMISAGAEQKLSFEQQRKADLKLYYEHVARKMWVGSFYEFLKDQEEQREKRKLEMMEKEKHGRF